MTFLCLSIMVLPTLAMAVPVSHTPSQSGEVGWWVNTTVDRNGNGIGDMIEMHVDNPLFLDDSNSKYVQSISRQKSTRDREKKEVHQIMQHLLRAIQVQHRKDRNIDLEIFSIVAGITRRVCSAQRVRWSLDDDRYSTEVFQLVDDMVSLCEYPRLTLKCRTSRKYSSLKQKSDDVVAGVTDLMKAMIQDIVNSLTTGENRHP